MSPEPVGAGAESELQKFTEDNVTTTVTLVDHGDDESDSAIQSIREELLEEKKHFPFMELPSELRLHIYRMALCRPMPLLLHMPKPISKAVEEPNCEYLEYVRPRPTDPNAPLPAPIPRLVRQLDVKPQLPTNINTEPIIPALLRVSQQVYREARPVLYSDNELVLHLPTALCTLNSLHQRSRSVIKHIYLAIPTHHDILEGFADLVRLGLRYCWGLKTFTIALPDMFPEERTGPSSTTNVYANAFHILRWLPKATVVRLEGTVQEEIRKVVEENGRLAMELNEKEYLRRQHQMPERSSDEVYEIKLDGVPVKVRAGAIIRFKDGITVQVCRRDDGLFCLVIQDRGHLWKEFVRVQ